MLWLLRRSQWDWQQRLVRLTWSSAWLPLWALPARDGQFHWSHGAFYFLILAGWPQLYTHKMVRDLAQKPLTVHIKPVPSAASSVPRSHARCSLCCSMIFEERVLRILCEFKHRPKTEQWVLRAPNNISGIVHHLRESALELLHGLCPASPCTHTVHKPSEALFQGYWHNSRFVLTALGI